jgi:Mn-dependent DtxR family transcriptional regulator
MYPQGTAPVKFFQINVKIYKFTIDKRKKILYNKPMKTNQSSEDYLESILLLSRETEYVHRVDVARKIGVSQPAVQKAINILRSEGYVECDGMHIYLTPQGEEYAKRIYERHCVISKFFESLGVDPASAETDACEIEHVLSDTTYQAIKKHVENN